MWIKVLWYVFVQDLDHKIHFLALWLAPPFGQHFKTKFFMLIVGRSTESIFSWHCQTAQSSESLLEFQSCIMNAKTLKRGERVTNCRSQTRLKRDQFFPIKSKYIHSIPSLICTLFYKLGFRGIKNHQKSNADTHWALNFFSTPCSWIAVHRFVLVWACTI